MITEELTRQAMRIIIDAGKGRTSTYAALTAIAERRLEESARLLEAADESIQSAHVAHTEVIQHEAAGHAMEYSMLFSHAEDTLMGAYGEARLVKKLLPIFEQYERRITELEQR